MEILVVIDMQKDFIDGALGNAETAAVVDNVVRKIEAYKKARPEIPVVYTLDTHFENYMETQEGRNLPVPHCIRGTEGWELDDRVKKAIGENGIAVEKNTFGAVDLAEIIKEKIGVPEKITLIGVCTDICVISNAMLLKAAFTEVPIAVDAECCAGVTPQSHSNALKALLPCQIIVENNN